MYSSHHLHLDLTHSCKTQNYVQIKHQDFNFRLSWICYRFQADKLHKNVLVQWLCVYVCVHTCACNLVLRTRVSM